MSIRFGGSRINRVINAFVLGFALVAASRGAPAHDAFDAVKCGGDIAAALIGQHIDNGAVSATEKKHASIGLKNEGGDEITDSLSYEVWTICANSYHLLVRDQVVSSAIRADHSRSAPAFLGQCEKNGKPVPQFVFAILKPSSPVEGQASANDHSLWPVQSVWRIDEASGTFVAEQADGMMCSRQGVSTVDGGS